MLIESKVWVNIWWRITKVPTKKEGLGLGLGPGLGLGLKINERSTDLSLTAICSMTAQVDSSSAVNRELSLRYRVFKRLITFNVAMPMGVMSSSTASIFMLLGRIFK